MKKESGIFSRIIRSAALATGFYLSAKAVVNAFNEISIVGKVVLITGGSRGLGLILARQLADEGAKVVICGRSEESLVQASEEFEFLGTDFLAIPCDITDKQQVKDMIRQIKNKLGNVDILINNAGIVDVGPRESMNEEDYEKAMNVHFWGPFYLMNEVIPGMKRKKSGRIVNIVSIGGKISFPHLLPYNTSKYALSGFSEGMTAELKKHKIKVTTVYPGLMRTGSPRNIDVKGQHQKEYAWFKIADSLPLLSINADRAAEQIIDAMKKGSKTLILTIPAKLAVAAHGIAPGFTISFFDIINFLFPDSENEKSKKGYESESIISSSFLTKKTQEAAEQNLEK
ncbi:MAG: SDR family oxidoreductase [Balneolaceae bacterium]